VTGITIVGETTAIIFRFVIRSGQSNQLANSIEEGPSSETISLSVKKFPAFYRIRRGYFAVFTRAWFPLHISEPDSIHRSEAEMGLLILA
jgi:hypothetical protein